MWLQIRGFDSPRSHEGQETGLGGNRVTARPRSLHGGRIGSGSPAAPADDETVPMSSRRGDNARLVQLAEASDSRSEWSGFESRGGHVVLTAGTVGGGWQSANHKEQDTERGSNHGSQGHRDNLIKAFRALVERLALRSKELNEEVRLSVWTFTGEYGSYGSDRGILAKDAVQNIVWDIDVLRLPEIADSYQPHGNTALIDGAYQAIVDLREVSVKYGDHSFLVFVLTDGEENRSRTSAGTLRQAIVGLPDNWTVAALVPDTMGAMRAEQYGFPRGNIDKWNTSSATGGLEVGERVAAAADTFLTTRSQTGMRGTRTLFADTSVINNDTVQANLKPADPASYILHFIPPVTSPFPKAMKYRQKFRLDDYVTKVLGLRFVVGRNYYELIKSEEVQPNKDIAVVDKRTDKVYIGREARDLIGLSKDGKQRLRPGFNPDYRIFIRSDSTNRNMLEGQRLLVVK